MCGICGFFNLDGQPTDKVIGHRMIGTLRHRGPDGIGASVASASTDTVFLGHTRLKIIDLSEAAKQPLANEDGKIEVIFNGEIYNFHSLRQHLEDSGHRFHSNSDTEVIVHGYEEFGDSVVKHLDGMFAFALWDSQDGRLVLARDRTGKKPLYYHFDGKQFTFGSEIKALLVCPWVEHTIALEHIPQYLLYGYVPTPNTMYCGIVQVPPASYLIVDQEGLHGPYKYWELQFPEAGRERNLSIEEAAGQVRELLTAAVARRLISDVPLGALLSGGLDSSIVVGIMSKLLTGPVRTFSIGFAEDPSFDERPYASAVAQHFKTDHTEFVVRVNATSLMERLLWHYDQPYGDSAAIPTYLLSKLTREHVTVALNGDGGDEIFAGYDRFRAALLAKRIPGGFWAIGCSASSLLPRRYGYYSLSRRLQRFFEDSETTIERRYLGWISIFRDTSLEEILHPDLRHIYHADQVQCSTDAYFDITGHLPFLHQLLYFNFMTYLPDDLHVKMDRMSMANSLETRSPMLDTALIEFVATLPPEMKIRGNQVKYILKRAFSDLLPPKILKRKKHGFGVPLGLWFNGDLGQRFQGLLLSNDARSKSYLDQKVIQRVFREHQLGSYDHSYRLWNLLQFEMWLRMLEWNPGRTPWSSDSEITDALECTGTTVL